MNDCGTADANWHTVGLEGVTIIGDLPSDPLTLIQDEEPRLRTGVYSGPVLVSAELCAGEPPPLSDDWADIADVSVEVYDDIRVRGPWDDEPAQTLEVPLGSYRMRVSAIGRNEAYDLAVQEPVERYLLQFWPASAKPYIAVRSKTRDLTERRSV